MGERVSIDRDALVRALTAVLEATDAAGVAPTWVLVGTAAALLRDVELPTRDVDLLAQGREDVLAFDRALAGYPRLRGPEWLPGSAQFYAAYDVGGVDVEVSTVEASAEADVLETRGPGPWRHRDDVPVGRYLVPTVALELRLVTELSRRRPACYRPILAHMARHGYDAELVERGLAILRLPDELLREVTEALGAGSIEERQRRGDR